MTVDDIITCMNIVKYYNPNMATLYDQFVEQEPLMANSVDAVNTANTNGDSIYRTLINVQVELANAVHDYTWNVIRPFDSLIVKSYIREQTCRDIFGLSSEF